MLSKAGTLDAHARVFQTKGPVHLAPFSDENCVRQLLQGRDKRVSSGLVLQAPLLPPTLQGAAHLGLGPVLLTGPLAG